MQLTENQRNVVLHDSGIAAVAAVAGSGKTEVLCKRALRLCEKGERVLTLAYNTDAAEQIRKRAPHPLHCAQTFHAFALGMFRQMDPRITVADDRTVIKCILKMHLPKYDDWKKCQALVEQWSYECEMGYKFTDAPIRDAVKDAIKPKVMYTQLIGSMVALANKGSNYGMSSHLQIDEAQDCTTSRWTIVDALSRKAPSVLYVGDPRQSIYGFQGANPTELVRRYRNTIHRYSLPENFRSGRAIVEYTNELVRGQPWAIGDEAIPMVKWVGSVHFDDYVDAGYQELYRLNKTVDDRNKSGGTNARTIHSAKGLEWDNVFVGSESFPYKRADPEEELRLQYVAYTRARRTLVIQPTEEPSYSVR